MPRATDGGGRVRANMLSGDARFRRSRCAACCRTWWPRSRAIVDKRGTLLGNGVYLTTTLAKALNYARDKPCEGVVLQLKINTGNIKHLVRGDPMRLTWHEHGFDAAHAAADVIRDGSLEEFCVRDPLRIQIVDCVLGNTGAASAIGYRVQRGVLVFEDQNAALIAKATQEVPMRRWRRSCRIKTLKLSGMLASWPQA